MQGMQIRSLDEEVLLEEKMETHSTILAWEKSHGQRSLAGYNPWGWKESDVIELLSTHSQSCNTLWALDYSKVHYNLRFVLPWSAFNRMVWLLFYIAFSLLQLSSHFVLCGTSRNRLYWIYATHGLWNWSNCWIIEDTAILPEISGYLKKEKPFYCWHELSEFFFLIFHFAWCA